MSRNLEDIAARIVAPSKGILASDWSAPTIGKRFGTIQIESNEPSRRAYPNTLLTMNACGNPPWSMHFSNGRSLQAPALQA